MDILSKYYKCLDAKSLRGMFTSPWLGRNQGVVHVVDARLNPIREGKTQGGMDRSEDLRSPDPEFEMWNIYQVISTMSVAVGTGGARCLDIFFSPALIESVSTSAH